MLLQLAAVYHIPWVSVGCTCKVNHESWKQTLEMLGVLGERLLGSVVLTLLDPPRSFKISLSSGKRWKCHRASVRFCRNLSWKEGEAGWAAVCLISWQC